jgi:hypothetical protein
MKNFVVKSGDFITTSGIYRMNDHPGREMRLVVTLRAKNRKTDFFSHSLDPYLPPRPPNRRANFQKSGLSAVGKAASFPGE